MSFFSNPKNCINPTVFPLLLKPASPKSMSFLFRLSFFLLFLAILLLTFLGMVSSRDLLKRLLKVTSNVARDEKVTATESPGCRCLMLSSD